MQEGAFSCLWKFSVSEFCWEQVKWLVKARDPFNLHRMSTGIGQCARKLLWVVVQHFQYNWISRLALPHWKHQDYLWLAVITPVTGLYHQVSRKIPIAFWIHPIAGWKYLLPLPVGLASSWSSEAIEWIGEMQIRPPLEVLLLVDLLEQVGVKLPICPVHHGSGLGIIHYLWVRMYFAARSRLLNKAHILRALASSVSWGDAVPPMLLIYTTAVWLTNYSNINIPVWLFRNILLPGLLSVIIGSLGASPTPSGHMNPCLVPFQTAP